MNLRPISVNFWLNIGILIVLTGGGDPDRGRRKFLKNLRNQQGTSMKNFSVEGAVEEELLFIIIKL